MQLTSTRFRGLPRLTVRRMMIYVAVVAVAIQTARVAPAYVDAASAHWIDCQRQARYQRQLASYYRLLVARHAVDATIRTDVVLVKTHGEETP